MQEALDLNSDVLYLSYLNLTELPREIGNLTNLKELWCVNNQLTSLPREISQLTNLKELWCSYNQLTSLPSEIGQLAKLKRLLCSGNQLTTLPPEIGNLTNLKDLMCGGNPFTTLPSLETFNINSFRFPLLTWEPYLIFFLQDRWEVVKCLRLINYERYDLIENNKPYTSYLHRIPPELIEEIARWKDILIYSAKKKRKIDSVK